MFTCDRTEWKRNNFDDINCCLLDTNLDRGCAERLPSTWIEEDDAMVRGRWRKMIRMVDEQEGCEWMNVSSGTGSPG